MSTTENLMELLRLAQTGFEKVAHAMTAKEQTRAKAALKDWTGKAVKARGKLIAARNAAALRQSIEELRPQITGLPGECHGCGGRLYFDLRAHSPKFGLDYLHQCHGTDTFDCVLQCLRHRSTPWAGPLVALMPKSCHNA